VPVVPDPKIAALEKLIGTFMVQLQGAKVVPSVEEKTPEAVKKVLDFDNPLEPGELSAEKVTPPQSDKSDKESPRRSVSPSPKRKKKKKKKRHHHSSHHSRKPLIVESEDSEPPTKRVRQHSPADSERVRQHSPAKSDMTVGTMNSHNSRQTRSRSRSKESEGSEDKGSRKPDFQTTIRRVRSLLHDRLPEGSRTPVKKDASIGGCIDKRPDKTSHYMFPAAERWDGVLPQYIDMVKNTPGCNPRKRSRPYYVKEFPPIIRKKQDKYKLANSPWTWEMPPPEPTIFQALVVNKEPELMLKGAAFKEVCNTLLQCSTILSHGEWLQCAVLELLDRLLDAFKGKMEDSAVTQVRRP
jgi:hypothetical protein